MWRRKTKEALKKDKAGKYWNVAFYWIVSVFFGDTTPAPVVICTSCYSVAHLSKKKTCECGGKYEPFDNWTWIEEDVTCGEIGLTQNSSRHF
jgi:hypothetical protein